MPVFIPSPTCADTLAIDAPILFMDRDGIINEDHHYVHRIEDFVWIEAAIELMRYMMRKGYRIVVVTNQSGIARGMYSSQEFESLSEWMCNTLAAQGIALSAVYYCPHGANSDCDCRKPKPGMLLQALQLYPANVQQCVMIGDKPSDMGAAIAAGVVNRLLVQSEYTQTGTLSEYIQVGSVNDAYGYLQQTLDAGQ